MNCGCFSPICNPNNNAQDNQDNCDGRKNKINKKYKHKTNRHEQKKNNTPVRILRGQTHRSEIGRTAPTRGLACFSLQTHQR
jgi:hypothetical protein